VTPMTLTPMHPHYKYHQTVVLHGQVRHMRRASLPGQARAHIKDRCEVTETAERKPLRVSCSTGGRQKLASRPRYDRSALSRRDFFVLKKDIRLKKQD
jgi:hypothetical protein